MKKSAYFRLFVVSAALLLVVAGCSNRPVEVVNLTPTLIAQVQPGSVPTAEQGTTPQNLPAPGLAPTALISNAPSTTPTPTPCPVPPGWAAYVVRPGDTLFSLARPYSITAEELQNINCLPSADTIQAGQTIYVPYLFPTATPGRISVVQPRTQPGNQSGSQSGNQPEKPNLKEQVFFNPGGANIAPVCAARAPEDSLQITISDRLRDMFQLCVYGFPIEENITVDLYAPDNHWVASNTFTVTLPYINSTVVRIPLWMPVGMPSGTWSASVRSASAEINNQPFLISPFPLAAMNVEPSDKIDPFVKRKCDHYARGSQVILHGTNLGSIQNIPIGQYLWTPGLPDDGHGNTILPLTGVKSAPVSGGEFSLPITIELTATTGTYWVIPVIDLERGIYSATETLNDCYKVP
jgi:LysM repeat protein